MDSTVQPDKKLMVATAARPSMSSTGLMMTPPPMPQMAPAMEAKKLTQRYKIDSIMIKILPLPRLGHRRACSVSGTAPETANGSPSPSGRPEPRGEIFV